MHEKEEEFSFKSLFIPFTTLKAIHWIIVIGLVVYFNSLFNGYVWDDISYILYNPGVKIFNFSSIFGSSLFNIASQYRPLPAFYFSIMYLLFKDTAFFYHFFSIVTHIVNTVLVFFLLKKFIRFNLSFFLSLILLVHPMQVESVAFTAVAGDRFFFLFGISALLIFMQEKLSGKKIITATLFLLLSILSKETGALFFAICFLAVFLYKKNRIKTVLGVSIASALIYAFLRFGIGKIFFEHQSAIIPISKLSLLGRLFNFPSIFFYYIKTFFFPVQLVIMQDWVITKIDLPQFYLPLLIFLLFLIGLFLLGWYLYKSNKKAYTSFIFFVAWFGLGIFIHSQIFPLDMTVADRWFYFPMVGLLGMIGLLIQALNFKRKYIFLAIGILILIIFSIRSIVRNADWHDDLTLYKHDSRIIDNFLMKNNIGWNYQNIQDWKSANKYYEKSVELDPYWAISLNNLAYSYEILGNKTKARKYFFKVLDANDYHPQEYSRDLVFSSWSLLYFDSPETAKLFIGNSLDKFSENGYLWEYLAISEYKLGNKSEAIKDIKMAIKFGVKEESNKIYKEISSNNDIVLPTPH